jgi:type II secretory pathway pseudopilin PulG
MVLGVLLIVVLPVSSSSVRQQMSRAKDLCSRDMRKALSAQAGSPEFDAEDES